MSTTDADTNALAGRFFDAIARGDVDAIRGCYDPAARVWHNVGGVEQDVDANLRLLSWIARNIRDYRYEEVRRQMTDEGFVQQHVLRATNRRGAPVEVPACVVARVSAGRITRIDEYVDEKHTEALFA